MRAMRHVTLLTLLSNYLVFGRGNGSAGSYAPTTTTEVQRKVGAEPNKMLVCWRTGTDKRMSYFELGLTRRDLLEMFLMDAN